MRCVICGREALIDGMCLDCYRERRKLSNLDEIIELVRCPKCGYFKVGRWRDVDFDSALFEVVVSKIEVHPMFDVDFIDIEPTTLDRFVVKVFGNVCGYEVVDENFVNVRIRSMTCERCRRIRGGYYEAIVQLRAENREIEDEEVNVVKGIIDGILERERENQRAFLSKVVERKKGYDFYFGDKNLGRKVSREIARVLGGKITESRKLHTRIDGRNVYRYTFAVKLPCYRVGDVVAEGDRLCLVTGYGKGISIEDGRVVNLKNPRVVRRREELEKGVVINCDEFVAEVVSENGIFHAVKSKGVSVGDEVYVIEHDSKCYVLKI
ncbi:MAG: hypothetical protein DRP01_10920 [Archaeoglobales archaeon]|nr:MAG: hypothetical protein DRP01_10920 [Archaeoglobales archaeon]